MKTPTRFHSAAAIVLFGMFGASFVSVAGTPPRLDPVTPVETTVDTPVLGIPIHVRDAESPAADLVVTAMSQWTTVIPDSGLRLRGTGETRWLDVHPALGARGVVPIELRVRDPDGLGTTGSFTVTVNASPTPLAILPVPPQRGWQGGPAVEVPVSFRWDILADRNLGVSASVEPGGVLTGQALTWIPANETSRRWLRIEMPSDRIGRSWVTVSGRLGDARVSERFPVLVDAPPLVADRTVVLGAAFSRLPRVAVDWDGERGMDFVVAGSRAVQVWTDHGTNFVRVAEVPFEATPVQLDVVDFDGDGRMDVVARGPFQLGLWRATPAGSPQPLERVRLSPPFRDGTIQGMIWRDWDGDGDIDGMLFRAIGVELLFQEGTVWSRREVAGSAMGWPAAVADADGDGDPDLIATTSLSLTSPGGGTASVWWNDGRGRFANDAALASGAFVSVGWQDWDADGLPDPWVMTSAGRTNRVLSTFRRSLGGWRQAGQTATEAGDAGQLGWGDMDADGIPDLVLPVATGSLGTVLQGSDLAAVDGAWALRFARGDGEGGFEVLGELRSSVRTNSLALRSDGQDGLQVAYGPTLFRTDLPRMNLAPGLPTGLAAKVAGNWVRLSWHEAWDLNQASGLTYNVRVGTSPGGNEVVPSMAAPDGRPKRIGPGNAGSRRFLDLDLSRIPNGPLYWSVQAVDASYAGGAFADEQMILGFPAGEDRHVRLDLEVRWVASRFLPLLSGRRFLTRPVLVESSTNLVDWTPVRWLQPGFDGRFQETFPAVNPRSDERLFLRAVVEDEAWGW